LADGVDGEEDDGGGLSEVDPVHCGSSSGGDVVVGVAVVVVVR
jgi:hypothetical protein